MRSWLTIVVISGVLVGTAVGRDIYVSNLGGNDRQDGSAMQSVLPGSGPVRTIGEALRLARAGDRIEIANTGRPYRESLSLIGRRHGGNELGPLVIEGHGAVLDGTVRIPDDQWEHYSRSVFAYRPARLGHQQLFLAGRPARRHPTPKESIKPPPLAPLEWCFWRGKILLRVEEGRLPEMYDASCCGLQTGITLYYVDDVLIRNLLVQGFAQDGIAAHDVVRNTRLEAITCCDNGMSGVSVRGASRIELDGCRLFGNGKSQLRIEDYAHCWLYRCQLPSDTAPAMQRLGGEVNESAEPFARITP